MPTKRRDEGVHNDVISEDYNSKELRSEVGSDEEPTNFPAYNPKTNKANHVFKVGMLFKDNKEFKQVVSNYSIKHGKKIRFPKTEVYRVTVVCNVDVGCLWTIYASRMQDSTTLQVKTFVDEHKCTRQFKNIHANSKWLADKYVDTVRSNPKILVKAFMDTIMREHVMQVSMAQVYGIRNNAFGKIEGTYKE